MKIILLANNEMNSSRQQNLDSGSFRLVELQAQACQHKASLFLLKMSSSSDSVAPMNPELAKRIENAKSACRRVQYGIEAVGSLMQTDSQLDDKFFLFSLVSEVSRALTLLKLLASNILEDEARDIPPDQLGFMADTQQHLKALCDQLDQTMTRARAIAMAMPSS